MIILNAMFLKWDAGTENAFLNYAKALNESGFETINLVHPQAEIISKLEKNNLKYIKSKFLGRMGKSDPFTIIYFKFLIKKYRVQLVIAHQGRLIELFKKALTKTPKLIGINHGHNPKHSLGTDLAITLNSKIHEEIIKLGQPKNKVALLPNGIMLDKPFSAKILHDPFVIGSYGRLSYEKGYDILIESIKILNDKNLDFYCIIGGHGNEEKKLKNLVKNYNLEKKVKFVGWVSNKEDFFDKIDLFIIPSRREEQGLVALESMANSTAILTTKTNGCNDLITDNENGFLTEIENPLLMADKLDFIIKNNQLLSEVSRKAFENLNKNYSYSSFKNNLEKIIKSYF